MGWIKTKAIIGNVSKTEIQIFWISLIFCDEKTKAKIKTKAIFPISEGCTVILPTKGISGIGLGFKTNHLTAPLTQGAMPKGFSHPQIFEIAKERSKIKEIA